MRKFSKSYAVIGLGFGDEGKGVTVNSLCKNLPDSLVVRYSGGQQAGHTVTQKDGTSHVFSNFGSGSLLHTPTYWSRYCTFDPVGVAHEHEILFKKGITPILYVDRKCPITTPYDKFHNQNSNTTLDHGTCGVGVGATFQREESFYSLLFEDLFYPSVLEMKLKLIKEYYKNNAEIDHFLDCCRFVARHNSFIMVNDIPRKYANIIFESSQGLLLDQHMGFFPHVTRSNVGTKNIFEIGYEPELFLVTRAFQTRHGNGPMTNSHLPHNIKDNPKETNIYNNHQGKFKKSLLDLDLLKYAIEKDPYIRNKRSKELVITCLDLVQDELRYTVNGQIVNHLSEDSFVNGIADHLSVFRVHRVHSPDTVIDLPWLRESYEQNNHSQR